MRFQGTHAGLRLGRFLARLSPRGLQCLDFLLEAGDLGAAQLHVFVQIVTAVAMLLDARAQASLFFHQHVDLTLLGRRPVLKQGRLLA